MFKFIKQNFICDHDWDVDCELPYTRLRKKSYTCKKCSKVVHWTRREFENYKSDSGLMNLIALILWIIFSIIAYKLIF